MKKVLIIGLCYADSKKLSFELRKMFDVEITEIIKLDEAKEYLRANNLPNLILLNRIIHGDKRKGTDFLDYLKEKNISVPVIFFSRFEDAQKEALNRGAISSFNLDLIIDYITPSRKEKHAKAIELLKKYLI